MKANRTILEDHLEQYERKVRSLKSFIKELNDATAKHGTDRSLFEEDLFEAEHNVAYFQNEAGRIRAQLKGLGKAPPMQRGRDALLPQTVNQGIGALILSSISFVAGTLTGSRLKARQDSKESRQGKSET